jgi:hypothetical protein
MDCDLNNVYRPPETDWTVTVGLEAIVVDLDGLDGLEVF